jgi:CPA2 family monovalent cation:H+ antiporter-2
MHMAPLIKDLAVILGVAAVVTFLFRLIRQPVVLGYIVAGIIVGPYTPQIFSIVDIQNVKVWADLGVIFFMFALGIEFSFRRLTRIGKAATITGSIQIGSMMFIGYMGGKLLGWSSMDQIFLGAMLAISSTTSIIKVLEELGLKTKKFAEMVYGILVVQDLAAILIIVALTSIATNESVSGSDLIGAVTKLGIIVGAWLVFGLFIVPRLIRAVGRHGTNEMLLIVSVGLCFLLVSLADFYSYSVALGAFIMGSILAETRESHHIQNLVSPLKDIFGAVFFVSVGMLLDPAAIVQNYGTIIFICSLVIVGMIATVSLGSLLTGQTISTSLATAFSLAQIGEFSFIIAGVGLSLNVISPSIYPIIVCVSLVTTFFTPYLIRSAPMAASFIEARLPDNTKVILERFHGWSQRQLPNLSGHAKENGIRWLANAVVVITIFIVSESKLLPWVSKQISNSKYEAALSWGVTFAVSSPFIWAMFTAFDDRKQTQIHPLDRRRQNAVRIVGMFLSKAATVLIVGALSTEFFSLKIAIAITVVASFAIFLIFRRKIGLYYHTIENSFISGIGKKPSELGAAQRHAHLIPWDAHLAELVVGPLSKFRGQRLIDLQIREQFGVNIIVIIRAEETIVAPNAKEVIFPHDTLLCFGTDEQLENLSNEINRGQETNSQRTDSSNYALRQLDIPEISIVTGKTIKESGIRDVFNCMVVGVERMGARIQSPESTLMIKPGDSIWLVGDVTDLGRLKDSLSQSPT